MEILFYIGIILLAIGGLQAFMRGAHSEVISGISLMLGTILVFVGSWHAGIFLIFMFVSWFLLMQIYRFSTYHRYFPIAVIFLVAYATLASFLLQKFGFENFIWWYLILTVAFLLANHKKQHKAKLLLNSLSEDEQDNRSKIEKSFKNTIKYHLLSSIVYILAITFAFFYFAGSISPPSFQDVKISSNGDIKHFSNSIDFANQATRISNADGAFEQVEEEDIKEMVGYYRQALEEARQVDIVKLNSDYAGFGDHYRNEFIKGTELFVEGFERSDPDKFLQGQVLLDRWGAWFSNNIDEIRKL